MKTMKREEVKEVLACLGEERRVFHYFKNRYCLDLIDLEMQARQAASIRIGDLKSGRLSRFVQTPLVAEMLRRCGSGTLKRADLKYAWPSAQQRACCLICSASC